MPLMDVTPEEARRIVAGRASHIRDEYFRQGLEAAAHLMENSGPTSIRERTLIRAIRRLRRPRKTQQKEG